MPIANTTAETVTEERLPPSRQAASVGTMRSDRLSGSSWLTGAMSTMATPARTVASIQFTSATALLLIPVSSAPLRDSDGDGRQSESSEPEGGPEECRDHDRDDGRPQPVLEHGVAEDLDRSAGQDPADGRGVREPQTDHRPEVQEQANRHDDRGPTPVPSPVDGRRAGTRLRRGTRRTRPSPLLRWRRWAGGAGAPAPEAPRWATRGPRSHGTRRARGRGTCPSPPAHEVHHARGRTLGQDHPTGEESAAPAPSPRIKYARCWVTSPQVLGDEFRDVDQDRRIPR